MYQEDMTGKKLHIGVGGRLQDLLTYIKHTRSPEKFNQTMWAKELNVNGPTMSMWLSGERRPNLDEGLKLCELYDIDLDFIYRGKSRMIPHNMAKFFSGISRETNSQKSTDDCDNSAS